MVVGKSVDSSHVFFEANDALTPNAVDGGAGESNLYVSVAGRLSLVNVLPDGGTETGVIFGAPPLGEASKNPPDESHSISSDGSTVFWTAVNGNDEPRELFVDESVGNSSQRTVQVDASRGHGAGGGGRFWTASSNGSEVFFTDSAAAGLTMNTVPGSGGNLYEYNVLSNELKDLTPTSKASVEGVVGASENGEYVYFVAAGALSGNSKNSNGNEAVAGQPNLYLQHDGENPIFIATLSPQDSGEVKPFIRINTIDGYGDLQAGVGHRTSEVSPGGGAVVFMSNASLTGYDNEVDGNTLYEVFVYEVDSNRLFCVSCNPSGAAPELNIEAEVGVGGFVPISWGGSLQWIGDDGGRVFFDSSEPLVSEDTDGVQDVYEWERGGLGSCVSSNGCVYLLSGGVSSSASWLEGVSESGNDVFFATRAQQLSKALAACRTKRNGRTWARCEAQARKRYGPVTKAKRSSRRG